MRDVDSVYSVVPLFSDYACVCVYTRAVISSTGEQKVESRRDRGISPFVISVRIGQLDNVKRPE